MRQKIIGGSVCLTLCSSLLGLFCGMVTKLFPRFWFYPFPSHTQTQNTSLHFPVISLFFALFLFPNLILPQLKFIFQSRPIESCRLVFTRCIYFHSFFFFFSQLFCVLLLKVCCFYVVYSWVVNLSLLYFYFSFLETWIMIILFLLTLGSFLRSDVP